MSSINCNVSPNHKCHPMFLKEFFYLPRSDRRSILAILALTVLVGIAIYALNFVGLESAEIETAANGIAKLSNSGKNSKHDNAYAQEERHTELFYFDPNTADSTVLLKLGLQSWQVRNIYKYRAKGGIYRCKEDFAFVYGLTVKEYRRLAPYIRISEDYLPATTLAEVKRRHYRDGNGQYASDRHAEYKSTNADMPKVTYTAKIGKGESVEINVSDTTALKTIPGIGSYFAKQIVRYRNLLGGFITKEQLCEIEGFPEEALSYIDIDKENIKKIQVNKLSLSQLRRHPYINYYQARAITDYRRLHGEIKDIREMKLLKEFTEFDLNRISPYLQY